MYIERDKDRYRRENKTKNDKYREEKESVGYR